MDEIRGEIKEKDLEQIAAVKEKGIKHLVSYDEDFEPFQEYLTPQQFIDTTDLNPLETEY